MRIDFLSLITAWGADFKEIGDSGRRTALSFFDTEDTLLGQTIFDGYGEFETFLRGVDLMGQLASNARFDFLGIDLDDEAQELFSIDTIVYDMDRGGVITPSPIPLPAGFVLLMTALGGLGVRKALG